MSTPRLPEELLDHVADHLHGERDSLKSCCLVSKSWIPRTRRQLFATISLRREQNLQSWKDAFPDPSASPGRYTKTLAIGCPQVVTTSDAEEGGWLSAFARIVRLAMYIPSRGDDPDQREISLVPFHGLFPVIRSLRLYLTILPSPSIFRLIYSFPPLENLHVEVCKQLTNRADDFDEQQSPVQTPNPPAFTGSLKLYGKGGWNPIIHSLLSLPGGLHFRSLGLTFIEGEDFPPAMALVERCRSTLESLNLSCGYMRMLTLCLFPSQRLISISARFVFDFHRPLKSEKTQTRFILREQEPPMDYPDTPNDHASPPQFPTNLARDTPHSSQPKPRSHRSLWF